jgi:Cu2+-exporting ATPase
VCGHCALPVPAGLTDFCCSGCRTAHQILAGAGLGRFYELADGDVRRVEPSGRSYAELDDPAFHALHLEPRPGGLVATPLLLEGVHCAACVWLTERLPVALDGVVEVRLDVGRSRADVVFDPAKVTLSRIARLLDSLGYPVHPYRGADRERIRRREDRALLVKIAVAGAAAGNIMLLAAALYAGMFTDMVGAETRFFRWTSMLLSIPSVGFAAQPFFRGAWAALRTRAIHLDVPIALGILVGVGWGAANTIRDTGEVYFDSIAMLVFLLLVARLVQARQQRRAASAAELLVALTPGVARRLAAGEAREVPIAAIVAGDLVEVRAGDTFPVDGVVTEGRSAIDLGLLTGESRPVAVEPGSQVAAGTLNRGARLVVRATATGEDTRIGRIARTVEEQSRRRAPIVRFADRVAARFVVIAIAVAAATIAVWAPIDAERGVENAMALLIVTCPCALGLATPMTFAFAIGRAARRGVLIKGGDALERLARPGLVFLDKTGTVTEGAVRLVAWRGDAAARPYALALEAQSAHPLARAIVEGLGGAGLVVPAPAEDVHETTGGGIAGRVAGVDVLVGSPRFVEARLGGIAEVRDEVAQLAGAGITPVVVALDGRAVAVAGLADPVRPDARATVARLRAAGWDVAMLSGDDPRVVDRVAREIGVDGHGGITPEGKLAAVREAQAHGPVVMVGDGVNDAAALAAASCGIAVHGGAEAAISVADVVVTARDGERGLAPVAEVIEGARATLGVVHRNLAISLCYNLVGAALAVTGLIHPLIGALMMPISSLSVVSSAAWSRAFRPPRSP